MSEFKVGDKVFSDWNQMAGEIISINNEYNEDYPLIVDFGSFTESYTLKGTIWKDSGVDIRKLTKLERALK